VSTGVGDGVAVGDGVGTPPFSNAVESNRATTKKATIIKTAVKVNKMSFLFISFS